MEEKYSDALREKIIVKTSAVGIVTNVFLASFKAVIGLATHSLAILLDGVNNFSDVLSSAITIVGAKLANKAPDREHPLGHGRLEYISAMLVAAVILYVGITALVESAKKIIHPQHADYSFVSLVIIAVAVGVKLLLGYYVEKQGKKVNSAALIASGKDAFFDAVLSASVLACAIFYLICGVSLEAYMGGIISLAIIRAGLQMLKDTLNDILGQRVNPTVSRGIKQILAEEPEIRGVYDLMINNYGPNKNYASVHIELPDTMNVEAVDRLTRRIEEKVYHKTGVILTGVGVYSYNTQEGEAAQMRNHIQQMVLAYNWALQLHGFYANTVEKSLRFDVVLSFDISPKKALDTLLKEIQEAYPAYQVQIVLDVDITD